MYPTQAEAELAIQKHLADSATGGSAAAKQARGQVTIAQEVRTYIEGKTRNVPDNEDLEKNVVNARRWGIGRLRLCDVTARHGRDWMAAAEANGQGANRRIKALRLVNGRLVRAHKKGWIPELTWDEGVDARLHGRSVSASTRKRKFYLNPAEVVALTEFCPNEIARLSLEVHLWTGMRPSEVRAMDGLTVNKDVPALKVEWAIQEKKKRGTPTKRGDLKNRDEEPRDVALPTELWKRLLALSEERGRSTDNLLFPADRGGLWLAGVWLRQVWQPALSAAQVRHPGLRGIPGLHVLGRRVPPTPYAMRATHVSFLQASGIPQSQVQAQIGHADGSMVTEIYTEVSARNVVTWPEANAARRAGLDIQPTLDLLYDSVWQTHGPRGGRASLR